MPDLSAPHPVFSFADRLVDDLATALPSHATMWGVPGHDDRWEDLSPDGEADRAAKVAGWCAEVAALPPATDRWARLAVDVVADHLAGLAEDLASGELRRDLRHVASAFQGFVWTFDAMDTSTEAGWHAVAARLEGLGGAVDGYRTQLAEGVARGEPVAARQVRSAITQGRAFASAEGAIARIVARPRPTSDPVFEARLARAVEAARGTYAALTDWLEADYLPRAAATDGVGPERYPRALRRFLGASPDLDDTIRWGWEEVRRLQAEMAAVADEIAPGSALPDVIRALQVSPADAPETFLVRMRQRQADALARIAPHFDVPDALRAIVVKRAPPGAPPGAWYTAPSEDLSRPGSITYSLPDAPQALWDEISTAYHEGFPGHHLQIGVQVTLRAHLSRLHRVVYGYSGFAEGWALYAEALMAELGGYELPAYELGRLANQMARACRVVFDVGAHTGRPIPRDAPFHPGASWSWDLGVALMTDVAGMAPATARSEVTRYYGWPGQAPSYALGQRALLELRRAHLGRGGDLRSFHARVLGCGNVALDRLRGEVLGDDG